MRFIRCQPAPPLDAFVECFWWSQRDQPEADAERMLPSAGAQLIIALHDTPIVCRPTAATELHWSHGIVHGPQWGFYESGAKPAGSVVGVSFRPGGAGAILGAPVTEFTDRHVPIDALWGARGETLREQLLAARSPAAAFRILERELTTRLRRPLLIHPAIAQALAFQQNTWAACHVADIQRAAGYSPRHFNVLFRAAVGLTPKHYHRVKRFTAVLRGLAQGNIESLADLAASTGYSDQAHMTREFREFAGITPTQYQPRSRDSIHHHRATDLQIGQAVRGKKSSRPC